MGDDNDGHVQLLLQRAQQIQNLGLDGHVQSGGGLVRNQQLRIAGQGHGDHHPLAHTAGELVGVLVHPLARLGNANQFQQLDGSFPGLLGIHPLVQHQRLFNLIADGEHRIQ